MKKTHKRTLAAGTAITLSAALAITAGAAILYSVTDISALQKALTGSSAVSADTDLTGDSSVNVLDLCLMKKLRGSDTGETVTSTIPVSEENVKFQGRYLVREDAAWLIHSGSAAEFTVTGTSASVTLAGDGGIYNGADYRPRYGVYVDGELILDTTMSTASETVKLFEGTASRTAKVKVMLLSEAMYGGIGVKELEVTSSAAVPVKGLPQNDLCIEFIGDSITCAYGVEGAASSESFKTTTENFSKSYAYLAAQQLEADYTVVSYSGHGIVSGYSSGDKNSDSLIPDCYDTASKFGDYNEQWDFSKRSKDAVVINLGTNDINYVNADFETRSAEFTEGYLAFLKHLREKNPDSTLICTLGVMGGSELYPLIEAAAEQFRSEVDDNIFCFESAVQNGNADGYGSDWHPSEPTQINNGYIVADKICQALGMESSQIGLDVAADGTYDVVLDTESGANAAHFVGYDKSFWINMVMGGDSADDIEGLISGIGLKAGGEYRLEFDYTSSVDVTMPVLVRGSSEYFSDSVSSTGEKQHFEGTFEVSADDAAAEIVFQLGGTDYYNMTISNVKLVKTK